MSTGPRRWATLAAASLSLLIGGTVAPSVADSEPTYTVTGVLTPTEGFTPLVVGLCFDDCGHGDGVGGHTLDTDLQSPVAADGSFTIADVPIDSYLAALIYRSPDSAGVTATRVGYLYSATDGTYGLATQSTNAQRHSVLDDVDLGTMTVVPPVVIAKPPRAEGRVRLVAVGSIGGTVSARYRGTHLRATTVIRQTVKGCGHTVFRRRITGVTGAKTWYWVLPLDKVRRSVWVDTVVSEPGHTSRVYRFGFGPVPGAAC